ncbi:hypothetical protein D3C73_1430630 [compost metagenome]
MAEHFGGLVSLVAVGQAPCLIQQGNVLRVGQGDVLLQLRRLPGPWRQSLQAHQILSRLFRFVLFDFYQAHAVQRIDLVRVQTQYLFPGF